MRLNRENFFAALIALEAMGVAACSSDRDASKDQPKVLGAKQPVANPAVEGGFPLPTREGGGPVTPVAEGGPPPPAFIPPSLEGLPVPAVPVPPGFEGGGLPAVPG